ncbi:signal peptidase I [Nocardioides sp. YR527]|uniref:signal peptidase I n=1 Tax=Nocardioides sp. YR527 TaxID=1881028 RepID=UPI00087EA98D|nr:signal peptidase I [Nocardioides sp. YR527]SDJ76102.1 signal peptidase I [Nocardioides sp. YR527]
MTGLRRLVTVTTRRAGDLALTLAAVAGVVCLLTLLAGVVFDVRPLVFRSGSMSPAIPTGSLALAVPVDHREIAVGDVISVPYERTRVTHRVVSIDHTEASSLLRMQGDANDAADLRPYQVTAADRVVYSVPHLGAVIAWLSHPPGIFVLAGYAALLLTILMRRRANPSAPSAPAVPEPPEPPRPRRRGRLAFAVLVLAFLIGTAMPPTWAAWADPVVVTGGTLGTTSLVSPTATPSSGGGNGTGTGNCQAQNQALGSTITLRWEGVVPASAPPLASYDYQLQFFNRDTNQNQGAALTVAHSGAAGSRQAYQQNATTLGNLIGLNLLSNTRLQVRVRSHLTGTGWYGATTVQVNFSSSAVLAFASFECNTA